MSPSTYWPGRYKTNKRKAIASTLLFSVDSRIFIFLPPSKHVKARLYPKCTRLNDKLLHKGRGRSCYLLEISLRHPPSSINREEWTEAFCHLHRWIFGINTKYRAQLVHFQWCNVILCINWYKPFNSRADIVKNKQSYVLKYGVEWQDQN